MTRKPKERLFERTEYMREYMRRDRQLKRQEAIDAKRPERICYCGRKLLESKYWVVDNARDVVLCRSCHLTMTIQERELGAVARAVLIAFWKSFNVKG